MPAGAELLPARLAARAAHPHAELLPLPPERAPGRSPAERAWRDDRTSGLLLAERVDNRAAGNDVDARRVEGVHRIAVLRPNAIGDFCFALPALHALRAAYPRAHITLLGRRWHREFLQGRPGPLDEVIELPVVRGVGAPDDAPQDDAEVEAFVEQLRESRFDLALQLYGGGRWSNPFVCRLGARVSAGLRADDAPPLDRSLHYTPWRNERARLLEAVGLVGAAPVELAPRLVVTEADRAELSAQLQLPSAPLVVLQPGATDARRRWPAERFAALGDALAADGACIAINGSADERPLVAEVARAMRTPVLELGDGLSLRALAALLAHASLVVSNDTGPLHLAQAVGTRTVGLFWFMNLLAAAPLAAEQHLHTFSTRTQCPVCGAENLRERCAHDASFIADIGFDEVLALARRAFAQATEARAPAHARLHAIAG
jgi:ADP-heptose:LPS heptosyltransferase